MDNWSVDEFAKLLMDADQKLVIRDWVERYNWTTQQKTYFEIRNKDQRMLGRVAYRNEEMSCSLGHMGGFYDLNAHSPLSAHLLQFVCRSVRLRALTIGILGRGDRTKEAILYKLGWKKLEVFIGEHSTECLCLAYQRPPENQLIDPKTLPGKWVELV